jgi:chromate transporter
VPVLRRSVWTAVLLDGINVAALGLMAGVTWQLGREAIVDGVTVLAAVAAAILLFRFKLNSAWLVLAGGVVGLIGLYTG